MIALNVALCYIHANLYSAKNRDNGSEALMLSMSAMGKIIRKHLALAG